jgi:hypothetical protein
MTCVFGHNSRLIAIRLGRDPTSPFYLLIKHGSDSQKRKILPQRVLFFNLRFCALSWDRTNDLILKRDLLYQLSYEGKYQIYSK